VDSRRFEQLSAYLDGELAPGEQAEFEQWLHTHPEAKRCYQDLARLSDNLNAALPVCGGGGTVIDLERLITQARNRMLVVWGSVGGAVAAALVVGLSPGWVATSLPNRYLLEDPAPVDPYLVLFRDDSLAQK